MSIPSISITTAAITRPPPLSDVPSPVSPNGPTARALSAIMIPRMIIPIPIISLTPCILSLVTRAEPRNAPITAAAMSTPRVRPSTPAMPANRNASIQTGIVSPTVIVPGISPSFTDLLSLKAADVVAKAMKEVGIASDKDVVSEFLDVDSDAVKAVAKNVSATKNKGKIVAWRRTATWLSAAASVALLVWGGFSFNDYRKTTGLGEEYSSVFTSSQFTRGGEDNAEIENKLAKLFDNVAAKTDFDNTLSELEKCWDLATQENYNDYTDYASEIGWNLAVGHLKNNDKKKAKEVLTKLTDIAPEGTAIGDKTRELLHKIW